MGGPRAMRVRRTLPQRHRSLIGVVLRRPLRSRRRRPDRGHGRGCAPAHRVRRRRPSVARSSTATAGTTPRSARRAEPINRGRGISQTEVSRLGRSGRGAERGSSFSTRSCRVGSGFVDFRPVVGAWLGWEAVCSWSCSEESRRRRSRSRCSARGDAATGNASKDRCRREASSTVSCSMLARSTSTARSRSPATCLASRRTYAPSIGPPATRRRRSSRRPPSARRSRRGGFHRRSDEEVAFDRQAAGRTRSTWTETWFGDVRRGWLLRPSMMTVVDPVLVMLSNVRSKERGGGEGWAAKLLYGTCWRGP